MIFLEPTSFSEEITSEKQQHIFPFGDVTPYTDTDLDIASDWLTVVSKLISTNQRHYVDRSSILSSLVPRAFAFKMADEETPRQGC